MGFFWKRFSPEKSEDIRNMQQRHQADLTWNQSGNPLKSLHHHWENRKPREKFWLHFSFGMFWKKRQIFHGITRQTTTNLWSFAALQAALVLCQPKPAESPQYLGSPKNGLAYLFLISFSLCVWWFLSLSFHSVWIDSWKTVKSAWVKFWS